VARLEQNSLALECESVALDDCVDYALKSVFSQALTANIKLTADIPEGLPPVWIDDEKIRRVLVNLLDNAVRHTPQHGQVHLSARGDAATRTVEVRVDDSGPGIPVEARARVFDKFMQLDQRALRGHKGTGLGLTFCKLAVEAHGGQIWVAQSAAGGASFCFTVPTAPPGAEYLAL
jgi:signal transduction histidine kinase